jgi:hypothetical protein
MEGSAGPHYICCAAGPAPSSKEGEKRTFKIRTNPSDCPGDLASPD